MKIWRAIIVDDEYLARAELINQLELFPQIEVIGEADDVKSAYELILSLKPDLVFLDIDLGVNSGFDLLEKIDTGFMVIFVTAHNEFAIRAFEVNALDYLLKPVWPDRLGNCIRKLGNPYSDKLPENLDVRDQILVKIKSGSKFIKVNEITCIEACSDYTRIYSSKKISGLVHHTLKRWMERLPASAFIRVHRSFIVNISFVESVIDRRNNEKIIKMIYPEKEIPISRRYGSKLNALFRP
jgi:two-component system LytT family response regulator